MSQSWRARGAGQAALGTIGSMNRIPGPIRVRYDEAWKGRLRCLSPVPGRTARRTGSACSERGLGRPKLGAGKPDGHGR